jgi:hypothetical protein
LLPEDVSDIVGALLQDWIIRKKVTLFGGVDVGPLHLEEIL